jgi:hypothetical protein
VRQRFPGPPYLAHREAQRWASERDLRDDAWFNELEPTLDQSKPLAAMAFFWESHTM